MAATSAVVVGGALAIKAAPAVKALVIKLAEGAAGAAGEALGHQAISRVRAFLSWRPSASDGTLRDQLAAFGLGAAESFVALASNAVDPALVLQHMKSALDELIRAKNRLELANVLADENMWMHQIYVHHLLVFVAYLHESRMGEDHVRGLGAVQLFLPPMFQLFAQKMDWARQAAFNTNKKQKRVIDAYAVHMSAWEEQLVGLQASAGVGAVRITREDSTQMVRGIEFVVDAPMAAIAPDVAPVCPRCGIGFLRNGGSCSNRVCGSVAATSLAAPAAVLAAAAAVVPPQGSTAAAGLPTGLPGVPVADTHPMAATAAGPIATPTARAPRWEWKTDDGSWQPYNPPICALLDERFASFNQGNLDKRHVDIDAELYVDLKKMVQAPWSNPHRTHVIRRHDAQEVWVRHTNGGRAFYRRPRDDRSTTLHPPPAEASIRQKEETGTNSGWFEERWLRLTSAPTQLYQHQHHLLSQPVAPVAPMAPVVAGVTTPAYAPISAGVVNRAKVLAAGDDVATHLVTVAQARVICEALPNCVGFCFQSSHPDAYGHAVQCFFKSVARVGDDPGWCTFLKQKPV